MKQTVYALFLVIYSYPAWGQIAQRRPEYCGLPGGMSPTIPYNLNAAVDPGGDATIYVGRGSSARGISLTFGGLPPLISEISQICPLADGRLVAFAGYLDSDVYIINPAKDSLVDMFRAGASVISPNQRWIVFEKAAVRGVAASSQYMLYDLNKPPGENRPKGFGGVLEVGRVIFPPGYENFPGSNVDLPKEKQHGGLSRFFWAPDSRSIVFVDESVDGIGVIWVRIDENGAPAAFRRPLSRTEICGREIQDEFSWTLNGVQFQPDVPGGGTMLLDVFPWKGQPNVRDSVCNAHTLELRMEDFQPAKQEPNVWEEPVRGKIRDGQVVTPPKKKE